MDFFDINTMGGLFLQFILGQMALALVVTARGITTPKFPDTPDPFLDYLENTNVDTVSLFPNVKDASFEDQNFTVHDFFDRKWRQEQGLPDPRNELQPRNEYMAPHGSRYTGDGGKFLPPAHRCFVEAEGAKSGNLGGAYLCRDYLWLFKDNRYCKTFRDRGPNDRYCEAMYDGVRTVVRGVPNSGRYYINAECKHVATAVTWVLDNCATTSECYHRNCPVGGMATAKGREVLTISVMNH